jgi:hypothetical protein
MTNLARLALAFGLLCPGIVCAQQADGWRSLFDGKSLAGWKESDFFGAGKVTVAGGVITLGYGALTGINWGGESLPFPRSGYEVRIEAARMKGSDFFAGITFPVGDAYCTWINGGWGGEMVGLSSIDGDDAAHNETSFTRKFELGHWYTFRLQVLPTRIRAWIDEESAIDVSIEKRSIALREGEIDRSIPFGIATYGTVGVIRKIEWRPVPSR